MTNRMTRRELRRLQARRRHLGSRAEEIEQRKANGEGRLAALQEAMRSAEEVLDQRAQAQVKADDARRAHLEAVAVLTQLEARLRALNPEKLSEELKRLRESFIAAERDLVLIREEGQAIEDRIRTEWEQPVEPRQPEAAPPPPADPGRTPPRRLVLKDPVDEPAEDRLAGITRGQPRAFVHRPGAFKSWKKRRGGRVR